MALFRNMLETPALCTLGVEDDFEWGDDLVNTQFSPSTNPVFLVDMKMNDEGTYYSKSPELFEVPT